MTTNIETMVNLEDTPIDSTTREIVTVEENQTLRQIMEQLWQAWSNDKNYQRLFTVFLRSLVSDPDLLKSR